ncbi:M20 metallopeptidase family protein [Crateriforma conspicua]|uniref:Putative hydrolase YxeP n=1 Tax=Crateriforma conspicua TaxID=2527996 RepID=A0A5C5Y6V4_9PLAN|nr:amidohydrolase [Crateriforma conspicua]TWT70648.1 putative hydrolase YxeP [Crateriforma conspicua]
MVLIRTWLIFLVLSLMAIGSVQCSLVIADDTLSPTGMTPAVAGIKHDLERWFSETTPTWLRTYRELHQSPELSFEEKATSQYIADRWRDDGFMVVTNVGGFGVVAMMENGPGPTVMLRCDMDALPVTEQTPFPFASPQKVTQSDGTTVGVMHACGHDIHMTNVLAVSHFLATHRDHWSGRLMLIAQPAEERGAGARSMLNDGLFQRFAKPDYAIALHVGHDLPAGQVSLMPGYSQANVDSVDITMHGRGGHGSAPETTIDPIVMASMLVVDLQTIVSREISPRKPAVITVGSIHGGTKHNIIGDDCHLQLTVRSYDEAVRQHLLEAIERKANSIATSFRADAPTVTRSEGTPSLENDHELAARMRDVFAAAIGKDQVGTSEPSMGGEDFSRYGKQGVPILMYRLGTVESARLKRYEKLEIPPPSLHSSQYYPDAKKSLRTAFMTMTAATLELLKPAP